MAFCPICKNEYREGILICPDCNCELTEELTETVPPVLTIRSEKVKDRFVDYLSYSGINTRVSRDENDERFELYCDKADTDRVKRAFAVFVAVETGNESWHTTTTGIESVKEQYLLLHTAISTPVIPYAASVPSLPETVTSAGISR